MSQEQPECVSPPIGRRDFLKQLSAFAILPLAGMVNSEKLTDETAPTTEPPDSSTEEEIGKLLRSQQLKNEADARNTDTDTALKRVQLIREDSLLGRLGNLSIPAGLVTGIATGIGALVQWRHQVNARAMEQQSAREQAEREAARTREALQQLQRDKEDAEFRDIIKQLTSDAHSDQAGAATRLRTFASHKYERFHEGVFDHAVDYLRNRTSDRPSPTDLAIVDSFFAVLPTLRKTGERSKPATIGAEQWPSLIDASHINLSGVDLSGRDLSYVNLSGGVFRRTLFKECCLKYTDLNRTKMEGAIIVFMDDNQTDFDTIKLREADMRGVMLRPRYLESRSFYEQITWYAGQTNDMILLGDGNLTPGQWEELTGEDKLNAIHIPHNHPRYREYKNRVWAN